jgi:hypothetical protein
LHSSNLRRSGYGFALMSSRPRTVRLSLFAIDRAVAKHARACRRYSSVRDTKDPVGLLPDEGRNERAVALALTPRVMVTWWRKARAHRNGCRCRMRRQPCAW